MGLMHVRTSVDVVLRAAQSRRGSTLVMNCGLSSTSSWASSASLGCSGNEADDDLQALTAQDRKFMLSTFIFFIFFISSIVVLVFALFVSLPVIAADFLLRC